jgi:hypothetical protein
MSLARVILVISYSVLSIVGLVGTWYFNLQFFDQESELSYLEAWFVNPASSSAAVDIIVIAVMASVFMAVEGWRLRLWWTWILIPLSFLVAVAFTFPLFLAVREVRLSNIERRQRGEVSHGIIRR